MTVATVAPEVTWGAQYSFEATTLDYLSPRWYDFENVSFATEEEADAFVAEKYEATRVAGREPVAYRTKKVVAERPETGYVDPFLEAEFAANRQYWADRARAAEAAQQAQREFERCFGRGAVVRVVKGRKVPVGTEGEVFWMGEDRFSRTGAMRLGFKTSSGEKFFTAASNCESVTAAFEEEVA